MSAILRNVRHWFRSDDGPPVTAHPWRDRALVLGLMVLTGVTLGLSFAWLTLTQQVIVWGLILAVVAVAARQGWFKLVGPVLFYDLIRAARRVRFVAVRTLYALFVSFILCWMFVILCLQRHGWEQPYQQMANFATNFLYAFLMIQFLTVVFLTPAYTAGAVAEEKERKTLEFILATDLRDREVVLGKMIARLLNLCLLLLAGLPILAFLQFLGGVDIYVVMAGFAASAMTMFSLAGISMLNSAMCRRARDAIVLTYLMAVAYLLLACGVWIMKLALGASRWWPEFLDFPSTTSWTSPVTVSDLIDYFNAGNIIFAVFKLGRGAGASAVFDQELPGVLGGYAIFHAVVGVGTLTLAILRLRVVALREVVRRVRREKGLGRAINRRRVGKNPMIWKEVFVEGGLRLNSLGRVVAGVLVLASFLPAIITLWFYFDNGFGRMTWHDVGEAMNAAQMRFVGTVVAMLMLLAVVVRAAGSVRSEHERHTFDELLTTRLTNNEILFGKWVGAILSVRWAWVWLGLIWTISTMTGGVVVLALPLIFAAWVTYATVAAGVGLWFSIGSRSSLRAIVASLVTMIFLCGGHWLMTGLFCYAPMAALGLMRGNNMEWMLDLQFGQTPPAVMGLFAFRGDEFDQAWRARENIRLTVASLFGLGCWAALVPVLWIMVRRRFEQVTGRTPHLQPERVLRRPRPRPQPRRAIVVDAEPPANGQEGEVLPAVPVDEEDGHVKGRRPKH
jgi:ABC-type transport system involved in multi-copper enzyme maturation permease subunit